MNRRAAEERIATLQARAQAQRLAAQLSMLELRTELAPLRSAADVIGKTARMLAPGAGAGRMVGMLARLGIDHPWLGSTLLVAAVRLLRRRPVAVLAAAAAGVAAWWLLRPAAPVERRDPSP